MGRNSKLKDFSRIPVLNKPRSVFKLNDQHTTTMDVGKLIPIFHKEVNPGETFHTTMAFMGRLSTQVAPMMDDLYFKTWFFFVPYRILWDNWVKMHGERKNPNDSIDYICPTITAPEGGFGYETIFDYMNVPPNISGLTVNALPFRAYNKIYNEYFRDENIISSAFETTADTGDLAGNYTIRNKAKIHDYFTSCLPSPQKGEGVTLPLGTTAPVVGNGKTLGLTNGTQAVGVGVNNNGLMGWTTLNGTDIGTSTPGTGPGATVGKSLGVNQLASASGLIAKLNEATAATIDSLNTAIRLQALLQLDARSGTRYEEMLQAHFSVTNPDSRLQKPEYLGGTTTRVHVSTVVQTSGSTENNALGELAAHGVVGDQKRVINKSFTEYGIVIGIGSFASKPSYQQGLERMYSRSGRYDYFYPIFNGLPEQEVLRKEIYATGQSANDNAVFGYQERYADYKFGLRQITGKMRSSYPQSLQYWHLAQNFSQAPTLSKGFIEENIPITRTMAVQSEPPFIMDMEFETLAYREMPVYNIPNLTGRFS